MANLQQQIALVAQRRSALPSAGPQLRPTGLAAAQQGFSAHPVPLELQQLVNQAQSKQAQYQAIMNGVGGSALGGLADIVGAPGRVVRGAVGGLEDSFSKVLSGKAGLTDWAALALAPISGGSSGYLNSQGRKDVVNNAGTGQQLQRFINDQGLKGTPVDNSWVKRVAGFAGDVASDPLTYLVPVGGVAEATGAAATESAARNLGVRALGDAAATAGEDTIKQAGAQRAAEIITKLGRAKTVAALTPAEAGDIGARSGFGILGHGDGLGQGIRNAAWENNPLAKLRATAGDILDRASVDAKGMPSGLGKLRGASVLSKIAARSGETSVATPAILGERAGITGRAVGKGIAAAYARDGEQALKDAGLKPGEMVDALMGAQGDREAAARVGAEKIQPIKDWYAKGAQIYQEQTGQKLPQLTDYVNRQMTDEMKALQASGHKGTMAQALQGFLQRREVVPGGTLFGETVPEGSHASIMKWANGLAQEKLGVDMYNTNLGQLMAAYANHMGTAVGQAHILSRLQDLGVIATKDVNATQVALKARTAEQDAAHAALAGVSSSPDRAFAIGLKSGDLENAGKFASEIAPVAKTEAARVSDAALTAQSPERAARLTEIANHYGQAKQWADTAAATAGTDARNPIAALRAQEEMLLGRMKEAGMDADASRNFLQGALKDPNAVQMMQNETSRVALKLFGRDVMADPEYARIVQQTADFLTPKNVGSFGRQYDKLLNYLKGWELATPRFVSHLVMGHAWNNALGGVTLDSYPKWIGADRAFSAGGEKWAQYAADHPQLADIYEKVRQVVEGGSHEYSPRELGVQSGPLESLSPKALARRGGTNVQRLMRGTMGMDTIVKGGTLEDAATKIARFHFDYGDLSPTERDVVRRIIPFYTWTRRNLPLQLEMMAQHPSLFSKYNEFARNIGSGVPSQGVVPSYFHELGAFPVPFKSNGNQVYGTDESTPLRELQDFASNPLDPKKYLSQMTPIIKTPVELWAGKQFYKDIPLTSKPQELPAVYKPFAPVLQAAGMLDSKGQIGQDKLYTMDQFLPLWGNLRRQFASEPKYQQRGFAQWLNFVVGTPLRVNTPSEQKSELTRQKLSKLTPMTIFTKPKK